MTSRPIIAVRQLPHAQDLPLPAYESEGAAGMDLRAAIPGELVLRPGERKLVPAGLIIELPAGFEAQVRPRSGLALKHGVTCLNAPGTIDSDYRGEVGIILINLGDDDFTIQPGMRIAQLVVAPVVQADIVASDDISATRRGAAGFGSTGSA